MALAVDKDRIYCGYSQGNVRIYSFKNNKLTLLHEFLGHLSGIKSLAITRDHLATGAKDGSARLWNKDTNEFVKSLHGHTNNVCALSFNSDKRLLATGAWDQKVMLFNY